MQFMQRPISPLYSVQSTAGGNLAVESHFHPCTGQIKEKRRKTALSGESIINDETRLCVTRNPAKFNDTKGLIHVLV